MKKQLLIPMLCAGALALCCCGAKPAESSEESLPAETAETTVTTTLPREYAENEMTTAAATAPPEDDTPKTKYVVDTGLSLSITADSIRPYQCAAELTNHKDVQQKYTFDYRILYADSDKEYDELPEYEPDPYEERIIEPEETCTLKYDWTKRYGQLPDGDYIFEILLETIDADNDPDAPPQQRVCRAPFTIVSKGFVPNVYFSHVDSANGTLIIENTADAGRSYCLLYRVYDADHNELIRCFDSKAQLDGIGYVKAGEVMQLTFNWRDSYGYLPVGDYSLVIELLADGEKDAKSYSIPFTIT